MKVVVAGAGLAGLAAGCELADAGHEVIVLERRPWAGGATYSFRDRETGEQVDNGQHIAMRCTTEYVRFLERLGTAHLVKWQERMRVPVLDADGRASELRADALTPPLHMLRSLATYRHLGTADKLRVARGVVAISRARDVSPGVTFAAWLRAHGQTERTIASLWDLIVVPSLNCRSEYASAAQALFVFREGFLQSATSAAIGVPVAGLSPLHVEPAVRYIEARGGDVRTAATVARVDVEAGRASAVLLASGERVACDACVVALPPRAALDVLPEEVRADAAAGGLASMRMAPIVNLHLWFDRPVAPFDFAAFTGCDLHWIFNRTRIGGDNAGKGEHLVVSLSAADRYMASTKRELIDLLLPQVRRALPAARDAALLRSAVVKEPEATFVPAPGLRRPGTTTLVRNLFLAGAHIDTGWPATMESAVRSGLAAARAAMAIVPGARARALAPVA